MEFWWVMEETSHLSSMAPLSKGNGKNKEKAVDKGLRVKGRKTRSSALLEKRVMATFAPKVSLLHRKGWGRAVKGLNQGCTSGLEALDQVPGPHPSLQFGVEPSL